MRSEVRRLGLADAPKPLLTVQYRPRKIPKRSLNDTKLGIFLFFSFCLLTLWYNFCVFAPCISCAAVAKPEQQQNKEKKNMKPIGVRNIIAAAKMLLLSSLIAGCVSVDLHQSAGDPGRRGTRRDSPRRSDACDQRPRGGVRHRRARDKHCLCHEDMASGCGGRRQPWL